MARPTNASLEERIADAELLIMHGWSRKGERALAIKHHCAERSVRGWREKAQERIRQRARPGATTGASLEDALARLEILWTRSLQTGDLRTARAVAWDRAKLLDLVPRTRVEVGGNMTIDVTSRSRVDVSVFSPRLLEAIASGASDDEIERLLVTEADGEVIDVLPEPAGDGVGAAHAQRVGSGLRTEDEG